MVFREKPSHLKVPKYVHKFALKEGQESRNEYSWTRALDAGGDSNDADSKFNITS